MTMSLHTIQLVIEVDNEQLAEHVDKSNSLGGPYSEDVAEWDAPDVFFAYDHGIIDPAECTFTHVHVGHALSREKAHGDEAD